MELPVIQLSVNGKRVAIDADADMPLLWVLRDEIGLKAPNSVAASRIAVPARCIWTGSRFDPA